MQKATKRLLITAALSLVLGWVLGLGFGGEGEVKSSTTQVALEKEAEIWTCAMHPQIRLPESGQCPICAMDLIPVTGGDGGGETLGARQLKMSEHARALAAVQTARVERRLVPVETRMVGKIAVDETRLRYITAWVSGRIDRLYVDYTGVQVNVGDHMAYIYSPELLTGQEELVQALRALEQLGSTGLPSLRQMAQATVESARERLSLWGLKAEQIAHIERERNPSDHLTVYASASGVVVEKHVGEGVYVQTGARIYTLADLSQVWLQLQVYESDLPWIRYGQEVEFVTEAYPGKHFKGRIAFIDPLLDERTRTVRVRVNVANEEAQLKPGMLVRAVAHARVAADGRVMDEALAGKWIGPMHPEIVRDGPGLCDICSMELVRAEDMGYMDLSTVEKEVPLVIPASAPLITGKRAVVYVAVAGREGVFEGREVELGSRAGDFYLVHAGLEEGEEVVVNGAFKIDSALQILAKPSMMNPEGGGSVPGDNHGGSARGQQEHDGSEESGSHAGHAHAQGAFSEETHEDEQEPGAHEDHAHQGGDDAAFSAQLGGVFDAYLTIQRGLSRDQLHAAHAGAAQVLQALNTVDMKQVQGEGHAIWQGATAEIRQSLSELGNAQDIEAARRSFGLLSTALVQIADRFGTGTQEPLHLYHCPMAFTNEGASWLQAAPTTENPYFGSRMFSCGSKERGFSFGHGE